MTIEPEMPAPSHAQPQRALGSGSWVILPTYNEADNLPGISAAILEALPGAVLLVVDDGSPDGTGEIADGLAAADPRVRVKHRAAKQGLGRAYLDGFGEALRGGATTVVQMDADWSHDPKALPSLIAPIDAGTRRPRHRLALHEGRRCRGLGHGPADHLARRLDRSRGSSSASGRTTSPAGSRRGAPRRSKPCRSTASAPAATCSRSR